MRNCPWNRCKFCGLYKGKKFSKRPVEHVKTDFSELAREVRAGNFTKLNDLETARELQLFLENLSGITSTVKSDHILNLFQEVDGVLPDDRSAMTAPIQRFLTLSPEKQMLYRVGRRTGIFSRLADMDDPLLAAHTERAITRHGVSLDNVDDFTDNMIKRFI